MNNLKKEMQEKLHNNLQNIISKLNYSHVLKQSMAYTVLNYGKLFRPCLALMILKDLTGVYDNGLKFASAIELAHVYGLLHDDLPSLDNGRYRRKKLVNHLVYGEAQTILAGDALQAEAFHQIALTEVEPEKVIKLVELFANMLGANGYVGGQSLDIISENEDVSFINKEMIEKIHFGKTGALIKASVEGAGILGNATENQINILADLAYEIGLAFQIRDDIIDLTKSEKELGKDAKSDLAKDKTTFPKLYGLEKAKKLHQDHYNEALKIIDELFGKDANTYLFVKENLTI